MSPKHICILKKSPISKGKNRAAAEKDILWKAGQTIYIQFLGGTETQHALVHKYASEWEEYANIRFVYTIGPFSHVRISFVENDGAWSYLGTVAELIPLDQPTMNLGWLDKATVLHEFGHMLGLIHEQQNPLNAIKWNWDALRKDLSGAPNFWSDEDIIHNVTSQYDPQRILGTDVDGKSIMMYPIPPHWTLDGFTTGYNESLSEKDKGFIAFLYPPAEEIEVEEPQEPLIDETNPEIITEEKEEPVNPEDFLLPVFRKMFPTYRHIKKMFESSVVELARSIGIEASIKDREIITVRKIYKKLYPQNDANHIV